MRFSLIFAVFAFALVACDCPVAASTSDGSGGSGGAGGCDGSGGSGGALACVLSDAPLCATGDRCDEHDPLYPLCDPGSYCSYNCTDIDGCLRGTCVVGTGAAPNAGCN